MAKRFCISNCVAAYLSHLLSHGGHTADREEDRVISQYNPAAMQRWGVVPAKCQQLVSLTSRGIVTSKPSDMVWRTASGQHTVTRRGSQGGLVTRHMTSPRHAAQAASAQQRPSQEEEMRS
ncbi:hypothetical protein E2P81_ATG06596 [Venturia nashicola]|uniref:Uncharacterized protein n=1 Tax=Venturia nashicola TaxID=86259 RepID=A0A4Z1P064_9PEZI|nr:hypothetical protein E6O75_ATG06764 [Venturia nashicola]TLD29943.1 hypothetical protein E2P81_ATG06596 [Venturia nashicola]